MSYDVRDESYRQRNIVVHSTFRKELLYPKSVIWSRAVRSILHCARTRAYQLCATVQTIRTVRSFGTFSSKKLKSQPNGLSVLLSCMHVCVSVCMCVHVCVYVCVCAVWHVQIHLLSDKRQRAYSARCDVIVLGSRQPSSYVDDDARLSSSLTPTDGTCSSSIDGVECWSHSPTSFSFHSQSRRCVEHRISDSWWCRNSISV